jgi:hypothetical protein
LRLQIVNDLIYKLSRQDALKIDNAKTSSWKGQRQVKATITLSKFDKLARSIAGALAMAQHNAEQQGRLIANGLDAHPAKQTDGLNVAQWQLERLIVAQTQFHFWAGAEKVINDLAAHIGSGGRTADHERTIALALIDYCSKQASNAMLTLQGASVSTNAFFNVARATQTKTLLELATDKDTVFYGLVSLIAGRANS